MTVIVDISSSDDEVEIEDGRGTDVRHLPSSLSVPGRNSNNRGPIDYRFYRIWPLKV